MTTNNIHNRTLIYVCYEVVCISSLHIEKGKTYLTYPWTIESGDWQGQEHPLINWDVCTHLYTYIPNTPAGWVSVLVREFALWRHHHSIRVRGVHVWSGLDLDYRRSIPVVHTGYAPSQPSNTKHRSHPSPYMGNTTATLPYPWPYMEYQEFRLDTDQ